ncbi:MAG: PhnA domain-containing protein [Saprospiraceae bacterium]|nr:PhnA domain-containing protein [Saprospiraceae bacterium]HPN68750.1 PhnA domain-containing protein [Saprospiraceae bacterium]
MKDLLQRAGNVCELCANADNLTAFAVSPKNEEIVVCSTCLDLLENGVTADVNHWRCLTESMWSTVPAVQVVAYRTLKKLSAEEWANDLAGMLYLDEETLAWAETEQTQLIHKDTNGNVLENGDTVTLIQDLNVKGANFTAKRGTAVRKIRLVFDNAEQIEGKVEGQQIVILTKYVKKS